VDFLRDGDKVALMNWERLIRRFAWATLVALVVLIFVGAIVRVTGSGLGCPDWPKCWGCLVPPTSVEDVDFEKIDLDRFKKKAERYGRDPDTITRESLRGEFNAKHTWIEFINRLTSLPLGFAALGLLIVTAIHGMRGGKGWRTAVALMVVVLIGVNAWLGMRVVYSGLSPGIITLHWALAFLLLCLIVVLARDEKTYRVKGSVLWVSWGLFLLTVAEALMGSQVRELTDELQKLHADEPRIEWTREIEASVVYLIHRSFSWLIFVAAMWLWWAAGKTKGEKFSGTEDLSCKFSGVG